MVIRSFSGSWSMASRRAIFSTSFSSGASVPSIPSSVNPSVVSCCSDSGVSVARSISAISSGVIPAVSDSSERKGSRPSSCRSRSRML